MEEFELEPGESIIRQVRKHWIVLVGSLIPFVFLGLLPLFALPVLHLVLSMNANDLGVTASSFSLASPLVRFILGIYWLLTWIGAFNTFTSYYLNVWVVTTLRIVDIHQFAFFDRRVSSFLLSRVQDVTTEVSGIFATLFHYGTVRAETAGTDSDHFAMYGIRDPEGMRDLIMREVSVHQAANPAPASGV